MSNIVVPGDETPREPEAKAVRCAVQLILVEETLEVVVVGVRKRSDDTPVGKGPEKDANAIEIRHMLREALHFFEADDVVRQMTNDMDARASQAMSELESQRIAHEIAKDIRNNRQ